MKKDTCCVERSARLRKFNEALHCEKSGVFLELFWSVFSHIRTEYGEIRSNVDQNNFEFGHLLRSVLLLIGTCICCISFRDRIVITLVLPCQNRFLSLFLVGGPLVIQIGFKKFFSRSYRYNEGLFLLTSYVVLDYDCE